MRFETSQSMKLGQQMKLAPRMIQSMEILQMPLAELQERIEQELESNVVLEIAQPEASEDQPDTPEESSVADRELDAGSDASDFDRLDTFETDNPDVVEQGAGDDGWRPPRDGETPSRPSARLEGEPDAKSEAMANAPARAASLSEQLHAQWGLAEVDPALHPLGSLLIDKLDEDGYLRTPLDRVADEAPASMQPVDPAQLERALVALQLFLEPPGIAARDARECLLLQLDAMEEDERSSWDESDDRGELLAAAREIVESHLDDLMNNRLPRIAERTGRDIERIRQALQLLRRLSLAPARRLVSEPAEPIIPDAIVEYDPDADRYFAYLNDSRLPNLHVNREYARMARDRALGQQDREFLRKNVSNAQWLIEALEQRRHTLLRVINVVLDEQRDFFDQGAEALRPLPMTQVAEQLGVHVATVSRAVADKHLMTPRGVVPLRRFFTGGFQTESGEEVSYDAVKAALKDVVEDEDKFRPFSDEALVRELKERGIEIARRTVAKYRTQLGIPSARLRKQH